MNLSPEAITVCLEVFSTIGIQIADPDAEAKTARLAPTYRELLAAHQELLAQDAPSGT